MNKIPINKAITNTEKEIAKEEMKIKSDKIHIEDLNHNLKTTRATIRYALKKKKIYLSNHRKQ